jgi:hypothetical protein
MTEASKRQWVDRAALAALAVLTLAFFWKIALTNRMLVGLDLFSYFYPYRDYVSEALRSGRLPLWNPYLFMGAPLLANSQAAVLYPLNWPLLWLSPAKQVAWSIVFHVWLAGGGLYLFARQAVRLGRWASLTAALIFALGGFLGAQVEHVNQLNASAWLPWLLLCVEGAADPGRRGLRSWLAILAGGLVVALMLLAGHTQAAYIGLFGAAVYALVRGLGRPFRWNRLQRLGVLALMGLVGVALAAAQLLPTLELSRLSVRGSGLPYQEAVSFSLKPGLIFKAFLPPLVWEPPFSEYVAYIGLIGLALAAVGAWAALRRSQAAGSPERGVSSYRVVALILAALGVFLAFGLYNPAYYLLYKLVPGIGLFRVPARWLFLYTFGAAILAGVGLETLLKSRRWKGVVVLLLVVELFVAGRRLAYNDPTAPAAYDSMRTAPAHLLAQQENGSHLFRFLSMSDIGYDPGDMGDLQAMYGPQLSEEAIYDLIVTAKMKEVLAFNLPLRYRLFSVDGYDGGLLPTARYVTLERLFLAEDQIWPDGRLRQQIRQVPPARLLGLLNVEYVITDKTQDVWIDGVYYDLEHTVSLGQVTLTDLPDLYSTQVGVVSYLTGTAELIDGTAVARVTITATDGSVVTATLRAGADTAEGLYDGQPVAHHQAQVAHRWKDNAKGCDYVTSVDLGRGLRPEAIQVESLLPPSGTASVALRGLTLIDERTGASRNLSVDPAYRLVHSGDVKIYRNLAVLSRAFVVHRARVITDDELALAALRDPAFNPAGEVILAEGNEVTFDGEYSVAQIVTYEPERIEIQVSLDSPGYLVLTDAYYPGWTAEADGEPTPLLRADLYFRGVALDAGDHRVTFRFQPVPVRWGLATSLIAWPGLVLSVAAAVLHIGRRRKVGV